MRVRAAVITIITVAFVNWMGSRATAIALPLVALQETGHTWATGLVLGAESLPLISVAWWGKGLRDRITTGRAVAVVMLVKAAGLAIVPLAAIAHRVGVGALVACGLIVGMTSALEGPAVRALLSDLGDELGPGRAARALTLQDLAHRCTMFLAPPVAALAVGHGHTVALLWSECAAVAACALLMVAVPGHAAGTLDGSPAAESGSIAALLRAYPRMTASLVIHGTVCLTWFAFSLGLAIAGAQVHRPGELVAAGMTGYGVASTLISLVAPALVNRLPPWPTTALPTIALGVVYLVLPWHLDSLPAIALLAAVGGVTMPLGIAAHNRILATDPARGPERRTAFTADEISANGTAAVGMLAGGAVIGVAGVPATLIGAGVLQILVAVAALGVLAPTPGRLRLTHRWLQRNAEVGVHPNRYEVLMQVRGSTADRIGRRAPVDRDGPGCSPPG